MKRFPVLPVIFAVVAFALSILAARKVEIGRAEFIPNKDRLVRVYIPCMGMDRFIADLKWVMLIQDMGKVKGKLNDNAARYFAKALDRITDLDPDSHKAYQMGGMFIANEVPQEAINLLQKGRKYALEDKWNLSYYSGFFAERFLSHKGDVPVTDCLKLAEQYYGEASKASDCPSYVHNAWMRLATRDAGEDAVAQLVAQKDFVLVLKPKIIEGAEGMGGMPSSMEMAGGMEMENSPYAVLSRRLIQRSSSLARRLVQEQSEAQDAEYKKTLAEQLVKVRGVFEVFKPVGPVCENCLNSYSAGQFFCTGCGDKVKPFGYCRECWAKGKVVLLSGGYCSLCGAKSPEMVQRVAMVDESGGQDKAK